MAKPLMSIKERHDYIVALPKKALLDIELGVGRALSRRERQWATNELARRLGIDVKDDV